jgi:hypothetical protein
MLFPQLKVMIVSLFEKYINELLLEAEKPPAPPQAGGEQGEGGEMPEGEDPNAGGEPMPMEDETLPAPEELELAKLAIRALNFNAKGKNMHKYSLSFKGTQIPFEKISDFFEQTKAVRPVLGFVEHVMDKYEGISSRWTEQPEIRGKSILDKIKAFNAVGQGDEKLDNGKRVYWVRIILNCLLRGDPSYNIVSSDVDETTVDEIFNKLKQDYGYDTRGLRKQVDVHGPGTLF